MSMKKETIKMICPPLLGTYNVLQLVIHVSL